MPHVVVAGTATGSSHVASNRPCEDSLAVRIPEDGRWASVAVCDGCGSASLAREGAQFISSYVADSLADLAPRLEADGPGDWVIDQAVSAMASLRAAMRGQFGKDIREYAATIVAALIFDAGGFILHIGDGVATSFEICPSHSSPSLSASDQSDPENGEYINETYYVTEPDWIRHIRLTPLHSTDCVILCTDGSQPLWYKGDQPNIENLIETLKHLYQNTQSLASDALGAILASREADRLSHDDKTAIFLIRDTLWEKIPFLAPSVEQIPKEGTKSNAVIDYGERPIASHSAVETRPPRTAHKDPSDHFQPRSRKPATVPQRSSHPPKSASLWSIALWLAVAVSVLISIATAAAVFDPRISNMLGGHTLPPPPDSEKAALPSGQHP